MKCVEKMDMDNLSEINICNLSWLMEHTNIFVKFKKICFKEGLFWGEMNVQGCLVGERNDV